LGKNIYIYIEHLNNLTNQGNESSLQPREDIIQLQELSFHWAKKNTREVSKEKLWLLENHIDQGLAVPTISENRKLSNWQYQTKTGEPFHLSSSLK
jgi:hypothetical protein